MGRLLPNKSLGCCEVPEHLSQEILAWLPLECLCKFRIVCKQWNCLISSTKFITNKWAGAPRNRIPWLVVQWKVLQEADSRVPVSLAYCFFTRTWKKTSSISLSFLLLDEEMSNYVFNCYGSAAGLFLAGTADPNPFPLVVSNPLTRTSFHLPPLSSIRRIFARGIVEGDGDSRDSYNVVVVGKTNPLNPHIVEIYDSTEKSWRIAGHLPEEVQAVGTGMGMAMGIGMVFCEGSFYLLTIINGLWGIMGFGIRNGISVYAPLPEMANEKYIFPYLLACGSRVLVTGGIVKDTEGLLQEVIIWEFEKVKGDSCYSSSSGWKEIARMPPSLYEDVNRTLSDIDCPCCLGVGDCACPFVCCVGVGDCVCFVVNRGMQVIEVVVYSVSERTWNWLPSCHVDDDDIWAGFVMAYEPRPDMNVVGRVIDGTQSASHSGSGFNMNLI